MSVLRVNLCPNCAAFLRALRDAVGMVALCESGAVVRVVARCEACSGQLPDELKRIALAGGPITTPLKERPS